MPDTTNEPYVQVYPDREVVGRYRYDAEGRPTGPLPGEHLLIPAWTRAFAEKETPARYDVVSVHVSDNSAHVSARAENLTETIALLLARTLNAQAGIEPTPSSPIGELLHAREQARGELADLEDRHRREHNMALARLEDLDDKLESLLREQRP